MALIQTVAPTTEPVTLADAKLHLRIPSTTAGGTNSEDGLIASYITVARRQCEHLIKRQINHATWQMVLGSFPECSTGSIYFMRPPISTVSSNLTVSYIDSSSNSTTLSSTFYTVQFGDNPRIFPSYGNRWSDITPLDVPNAVTVQYVAGFSSSTTGIPEDIKQWILMRVGSLYENRESVSLSMASYKDLPRAYYDSLLDPWMIVRF